MHRRLPARRTGRLAAAAWLATLLALVALPGCGRHNMAAVTGTVTYQGRPVPDAFVMFSPAAGPAAGAVTDAAGIYILQTGGPYGDRVFTGRCHIAVSDANPEGRSRDVRILPRLADAGMSGLVADLTPGANVVNLELPEQ